MSESMRDSALFEKLSDMCWGQYLKMAFPGNIKIYDLIDLACTGHGVMIDPSTMHCIHSRSLTVS
jgi:hypothetical protein